MGPLAAPLATAGISFLLSERSKPDKPKKVVDPAKQAAIKAEAEMDQRRKLLKEREYKTVLGGKVGDTELKPGTLLGVGYA